MLCLSRGEDSLVLAPEFGGSVIGWTRRGANMFRRASPGSVMLGRPSAMGCFPLVPFCNRIAWRRFCWAGEMYELAANFGDRPHAIHGVGWQTPWQLEKTSSDSAILRLDHAGGLSWPFPFTARITYRLDDRGLTIEIEATNRHSAAAPMGIGAHPWFPRTADASISFASNGVWFAREGMPTTRDVIPPNWNHAAGRPVENEPLDNCFTGWDGTARLRALTIEADPIFGNLQVFTPREANFFCVEPNSHVPDAINRPELPRAQAMDVLPPGETLAGSIIFRVE